MVPRSRRISLALLALVALVVGGYFLAERSGASRSDGAALSSLPAEAVATWELIETGGPFPYPADGGVFQNRERLLPEHDPGYYKEYTVPTPGSRDRGARRLVTGSAEELYYTADHYRSFTPVDVDR